MNIVSALFRLILIVLLTSCAGSPHKETSAKGSGVKGETELRAELHAQLERRNFLNALRLMQQEVLLGRSESSLSKEYGLALRGGMNYGDELLRKGEISKSGVYFRQMLNLYPRSLPAVSGVSARMIENRLSECSDQLMANGLAEYRAGQMQQAIDLWTELLAFNPERTEAIKAISTSSIQMRNLKPSP